MARRPPTEKIQRVERYALGGRVNACVNLKKRTSSRILNALVSFESSLHIEHAAQPIFDSF